MIVSQIQYSVLFLCPCTTIGFEVKVGEFEKGGSCPPMYERGFSRGEITIQSKIPKLKFENEKK